MGRKAVMGRALASNEDVKVTWALIKRVFAYVRPHWIRVIVLVVVTAAGAYVDTVMPQLYRKIVDDALPSGDMAALSSLSYALFGVVSAKSALRVLRSWMSAVLGEKIAERLRMQLFRHLQRMPMGFFVHQKPGAFTTLFTSELAGAKAGIGRVFPRVTASLMTLIFTMSALVSMDSRLALISLFMLPFFQLPTSWASRSLKRAKLSGLNAASVLTTAVQESLSLEGWMLHRVYQRDEHAVGRFSESNKAVSEASVKFDISHAFLEQGLYLSVTLGTTLMYFAGGSLATFHGVSAGDIVMFASYIGRLFGPMKDLMNIRLMFASAAVSFLRLFSYLDRPVERGSDSHNGGGGHETEAESMDDEGGGCVLELARVSCTYPSPDPTSHSNVIANDNGDSKLNPGPEHGVSASASGSGSDPGTRAAAALSDVSFSAVPGTLIAIVGENGAGKSTLALVLSRFLHADAGAVLYSGRDIRSLSPKALRSRVCLVGRAFLLNDTVTENLRYGRPDATQSEIEGVCRLVGLHDLISGLPEGYSTPLGEHGFRLSGGEGQRLSLARGLLANPSVLILDEALSHIDTAGEARLLELIKPLRCGTGRTTVIVSHRLSTVSACERILVLERGRLVEDGSLAELTANRGCFCRLFGVGL